MRGVEVLARSLGDVREHYWILPLSKDVIWNRLYALRWSNLLTVSVIFARMEQQWWNESWYTQLAHETPNAIPRRAPNSSIWRGKIAEYHAIGALYKFPLDDVSREAACNFWVRFSEPIRLRYRWLPARSFNRLARYNRQITNGIQQHSSPFPVPYTVHIFHGDWRWLFIRLTKHGPGRLLAISVQLESSSHGWSPSASTPPTSTILQTWQCCATWSYNFVSSIQRPFSLNFQSILRDPSDLYLS